MMSWIGITQYTTMWSHVLSSCWLIFIKWFLCARQQLYVAYVLKDCTWGSSFFPTVANSVGRCSRCLLPAWEAMVEQKRLDWKRKQARLWCGGSVTSCWNTSPGTGWLRTTEHILPCLEARGLQSRCRQAVFFWGPGRQPTNDYVWLQAVLGTPWLELHHPVSASFTTWRPSLVSCFYVSSSLGKTLDMGFRDCSTVTFFFFSQSLPI